MTEAPTEALTEAPTEAPATEAPATGQVEIFSWWVGGGEAAGLTAMTEVFNTEYPDLEFVNAAVAGGSGTNARAVLATRLQAGDPPDSWQAHAGQEIIGTYVAADQVARWMISSPGRFLLIFARNLIAPDLTGWTSVLGVTNITART
jgi:glucose/mannose transport system substrate-binding protein